MNSKTSAVGLFFSMFLRAVVIILAIVILVVGVFVAKKAISNKKNTTEEASVDESILTAEDDQVDEALLGQAEDAIGGTSDGAAASSMGLKIEVLNATDTKGLAGKWKDNLAGKGYTNVDAHNFHGHLENTKILVAADGTGEDLKAMFPNADYEVGTLTSNETDAPTEGVDIYLIIGVSDDTVSQ